MTTKTHVYKMSRPVSVYDWYHIFHHLGTFTGDCTRCKYKPSYFGRLSMSWLDMDITIHTNKQDPSREFPEFYMREETKHIPVLPFDVAEADRVFRGEPASDANDVFLTVTNGNWVDMHSELKWIGRQYLAKENMNVSSLDDLLPEFRPAQVSYDSCLSTSDVEKLKNLPINRITSWFVDHLKSYYDKMRIRQSEYMLMSCTIYGGIRIIYYVMLNQHDDITGRYENIEMRASLDSYINKFTGVLQTKLNENHAALDIAALQL